MVRTLPLLLLTACGAVPDTLLDELRVISLRADPAAVSFQDPTTLTATVFRPTEAPTEVLLWTCIPSDGACLEGTLVPEWTDWTSVTTLEGAAEDANLTLTWPVGTASLWESVGERASLPVWALACNVGRCPLIETVRQEPALDSPEGEAAMADLAAVTEAIGDLPLTGTALSLRAVPVALPGVDAENPVVEATSLPSSAVAAEEEASLTFQVTHPGVVRAYPMTDAGGFTNREVTVRDGSVTLTWVGPAEAGTARIYVAFEAEDGGSTLWRGTLEAAGE